MCGCSRATPVSATVPSDQLGCPLPWGSSALGWVTAMCLHRACELTQASADTFLCCPECLTPFRAACSAAEARTPLCTLSFQGLSSWSGCFASPEL